MKQDQRPVTRDYGPKGKSRKSNFFFAFLFLVTGFWVLVCGLSLANEIRGAISVAAPYPAVEKITVKKKVQDSCAEERYSLSLIVSDKGFLKNAVVYLKGDYAEPLVPKEVPVLNQTNCNYEPHVLLVPQNGKFKVSNGDPLDHDVRAFEDAKMLFRFEIGTGDKAVEREFSKGGIYVMRCGLHPWMHSYVVAAPHAHYAVTDENGNFVLENVPPGKHVLSIWHEKLGETEIPVDVAQPVEEVTYTFKP